jgi:hypothetical protein
MSKKVITLKFYLVCTIILGNGKDVLVIRVKLLMIGFIVLLISYSIPRISNISILIGLINLANMKTFGLLCHTFHIELIILLRVFGALCYFGLFFCRMTYSNWRLLNLVYRLSWLRLIASYFLLRIPLPDFLIVMVRFLMPFQLPLPFLV